MSTNVLITGGAGYLGSIMVPKFLAEGYSVTVIDNFSNKRLECYYHQILKFIVEMLEKEDIMPVLKKADVIIPLVAVGAPLCDKDPIGASSVNKTNFLMLDNISKLQLVLMPTTNSIWKWYRG